jgi:hypothetical protein
MPFEEEQSVVEASNSPTAPIYRAIETEIGSNVRENSDNNNWEKRLKAMTTSCRNLPFSNQTMNQI